MKFCEGSWRLTKENFRVSFLLLFFLLFTSKCLKTEKNMYEMQVVVLSKKATHLYSNISVYKVLTRSCKMNATEKIGVTLWQCYSQKVCFQAMAKLKDWKLMYANVLVLQSKIKKPKTTKQPRLILL